MIKLIIFDWDDVFTIGSKKGYYACYHKAITDVGIHLDPAEEEKRILAKWGTTHVEELKELLKEHPELVDMACQSYEEALFGEVFTQELHVLPNTAQALESLQEITLCVATGGHPDIIKRSMKTFAIPNVFSEILSSYSLLPEQQKPAAYMVEHLMRTHNTTKHETIVVGDGKSDMLMAQNAGVTAVAVLTGHLTRAEAEAFGVEHIIADITALPALVQQLKPSRA